MERILGAGLVGSARYMELSTPVKEPRQEGSVYLFSKVLATSTFVICYKAVGFTFEGVGSASSDSSVFYVAVIGEELFKRGAVEGLFF